MFVMVILQLFGNQYLLQQVKMQKLLLQTGMHQLPYIAFASRAR